MASFIEMLFDPKYVERARARISDELSSASAWVSSNSVQKRAMLSARPEACATLATEAWRRRKREFGVGMLQCIGSWVRSTTFPSYTSISGYGLFPHLQRYRPTVYCQFKPKWKLRRLPRASLATSQNNGVHRNWASIHYQSYWLRFHRDRIRYCPIQKII